MITNNNISGKIEKPMVKEAWVVSVFHIYHRPLAHFLKRRSKTVTCQKSDRQTSTYKLQHVPVSRQVSAIFWEVVMHRTLTNYRVLFETTRASSGVCMPNPILDENMFVSKNLLRSSVWGWVTHPQFCAREHKTAHEQNAVALRTERRWTISNRITAA